MGVLDDLKKEAEAKKKGQESAAEVDKEAIERRLLTRIDDLYHYFKEFQRTLEEASPEISVNMDVEGFGTLEGLAQGDYKIATDNPEDIRRFQFHFKLVGPPKPRRELKFTNRTVAAKQKEVLWNANLKFAMVDTPGGGAAITLEPIIPVSLEFDADVEKDAVRLRVKNMPRIGPYSYTFASDRVNSDLMDEIAKYILRKDNRFDELTGNTVSEETLLRIREQLQKQQGAAPAEQAAATEEEKKGSVTSKLKSVLTTEIKFRR